MRVLRAPTLVCSLLTIQHTVAFLPPAVRIQSSYSRFKWASSTGSSSGAVAGIETSVPCTILRAAEGSRDRPLDADIKDRDVDSTGNEVLREAGQAWAGAALDLVGSAVDAVITTVTKKDDGSSESELLSSLIEPQGREEERSEDQHGQRDSEEQRDDVRARHAEQGQRDTEPSRDENGSGGAMRGGSTQDRTTTHTESHGTAEQGFAAGQGFETLRAERQKDEDEDAGQGSIVAEGDELTAGGKTVTEWMEEAAPRAFDQNADSDSSSRVGPPLPETSPDKFNPTPPTAGLKATHTTSGVKPGRITSAQPAPPS